MFHLIASLKLPHKPEVTEPEMKNHKNKLLKQNQAKTHFVNHEKLCKLVCYLSREPGKDIILLAVNTSHN